MTKVGGHCQKSFSFLIITLNEETGATLEVVSFYLVNMAFRSILISEATKINLDLNNIVIQYSGDSYRINIDEISTLI